MNILSEIISLIVMILILGVSAIRAGSCPICGAENTPDLCLGMKCSGCGSQYQGVSQPDSDEDDDGFYDDVLEGTLTPESGQEATDSPGGAEACCVSSGINMGAGLGFGGISGKSGDHVLRGRNTGLAVIDGLGDSVAKKTGNMKLQSEACACDSKGAEATESQEEQCQRDAHDEIEAFCTIIQGLYFEIRGSFVELVAAAGQRNYRAVKGNQQDTGNYVSTLINLLGYGYHIIQFGLQKRDDFCVNMLYDIIYQVPGQETFVVYRYFTGNHRRTITRYSLDGIRSYLAKEIRSIPQEQAEVAYLFYAEKSDDE